MIYLLEDDTNIRSFVIYALRSSGFEAEGFELPSQFWAAMKKQKPSLAVLDIMLPEEDGLSVLRKLRDSSETRNMPVIMLTAKSTEYDKVMGLDAGADDYMTKPFGAMELVARVKALLRRAEPVKDGKEYRVGSLLVNPDKHIVRAEDSDVILTLKEFQLLCYLVKNQGNVMTRDQILQEIWGYEFDGENRTVDVHIRTLRSKLGAAGDLIETVRGIGYRIGGK
ncbi:MAG: response regulator transcription factor [Firmicutes bacterium]|nr:response regulator transcription factor [Bacillota bacterium]MBR6585391.1 response regulator transcription factor [Bacillota bacterium]